MNKNDLSSYKFIKYGEYESINVIEVIIIDTRNREE